MYSEDCLAVEMRLTLFGFEKYLSLLYVKVATASVLDRTRTDRNRTTYNQPDSQYSFIYLEPHSFLYLFQKYPIFILAARQGVKSSCSERAKL